MADYFDGYRDGLNGKDNSDKITGDRTSYWMGRSQGRSEAEKAKDANTSSGPMPEWLFITLRLLGLALLAGLLGDTAGSGFGFLVFFLGLGFYFFYKYLDKSPSKPIKKGQQDKNYWKIWFYKIPSLYRYGIGIILIVSLALWVYSKYLHYEATHIGM